MSSCYIALVFLFLSINNTVKAEDMDSGLSTQIAKFSAKFLKELDVKKSVICSPLSAEYVLALVALGATNQGHDEILTALGINDDDEIRSSFTAVSSKLKSVKGVTLDVANKVYLMENGEAIHPNLQKDAVNVFDAGIEKVNFADGAAAAKQINGWVEKKTNNRIKDLLSADSFDVLTRLVLVNALYFKGTWEKQFNPAHTAEQPFHIDGRSTVNVQMMYKEDNFKYGESEELSAQLLEMSYKGGEASMVVILPTETTGLSALLKKLADGHDLLAELNSMHSTKVQVHLPKFKIETEIDLKALLPKLGIQQIFVEGQSGLTRMLQSNQPLHVSKAVQKAFIEVNEEGAEAAAATAMGIAMCSAMVDFTPVPAFIADHPFLVIILVDKTPYFLAAQHGQF